MEWEGLVFKYRWQFCFLLFGLMLFGLGAYVVVKELVPSGTQVEIIESETVEETKKLIVEVAGGVERPGVYEFDQNQRVEDALTKAGGLSVEADELWVERALNRAAILNDGQKIYIPLKSESGLAAGKIGETLGSFSQDLININSASASELETLWGIGEVTARNIIEERPYSSVEELLDKKILKQNVYDRNKDKLTIY